MSALRHAHHVAVAVGRHHTWPPSHLAATTHGRHHTWMRLFAPRLLAPCPYHVVTTLQCVPLRQTTLYCARPRSTASTLHSLCHEGLCRRRAALEHATPNPDCSVSVFSSHQSPLALGHGSTISWLHCTTYLHCSATALHRVHHAVCRVRHTPHRP